MRILLRGTVGGDQLTALQTIVELDVFSGRPNPRWKLDDQASQELLELQARLSVSIHPPAEPPGLGYRGFVYAMGKETCRAYNGYVRASRSILVDPELRIERFLLNSLPVEYESLKSRVGAELARPAR